MLKFGHFEKQIRNNCKVLNVVLGKDGWSEHVRNEELFIASRRTGIFYLRERRKANWIAYILRGNCLLKHVIEEKIGDWVEVKGRRG